MAVNEWPSLRYISRTSHAVGCILTPLSRLAIADIVPRKLEIRVLTHALKRLPRLVYIYQSE